MPLLLALQDYALYLPQNTAVIEVSREKIRSWALKEHNTDNLMHPDLYIKYRFGVSHGLVSNSHTALPSPPPPFLGGPQAFMAKRPNTCNRSLF